MEPPSGTRLEDRAAAANAALGFVRTTVARSPIAATPTTPIGSRLTAINIVAVLQDADQGEPARRFVGHATEALSIGAVDEARLAGARHRC